MKRIVTYVVISLVTFACVNAVKLLLTPRKPPTVRSARRAEVVATPASPPAPAAVVTPTPELEVAFGSRGLKVVPNEVQLTSERRHYEIHMSYPQIEGSKDLHIRRLNHRIKGLTSARYQWALNISEKELRDSLRMHPEVTNTVDSFYEVTSASDSMVSINFGVYSYGIGAAHGVQESFVVNYDFRARRVLRLSDLFAPGSKYLEFISQYCNDEFKRHGQDQSLLPEALAPVSRSFESWNVTPTGIRFNFDQCKIFGCSGGPQEVEIPYSNLKPIFSRRAMSILPISSVAKVKADHK